MGRYGGQKRRATTSKLYAMDKDYDKVLSDAKVMATLLSIILLLIFIAVFIYKEFL
jgi:hypothetical protein